MKKIIIKALNWFTKPVEMTIGDLWFYGWITVWLTHMIMLIITS